ncbi:MAG: hypothetical protein JOZ22_04850 [Acidobacteriia bacterium]|nr:hypothetical protein [Terriglobia bacterium]
MLRTRNGPLILWLTPLGLALAGLVLTATYSPAVVATAFQPGNLVVSRSVYQGTASTVTIGEQLPPGCALAMPAACVSAVADGTYPGVFNNNSQNGTTVDGSFGVTSPIFLDQTTTGGVVLNTLAVSPNLVTTSFSSKSELALNLSDTGTSLTFMGYVAPVNALDVSNSNTPGVSDPTNPDQAGPYYRAVVEVDANGNFQVTDINAYAGNNGRAAIRANGLYFMSGNSNNGTGTPANVVAAAGIQVATAGQTQNPPQEVGNFSITQYGYAADKLGKDNNFRGLTVFNNTLYTTKGSGSNGINTVYEVGTAGSLPTLLNAATTPITILPGFTQALAKPNQNNPNYYFPFGIWFANANTLYVADEGDGVATDATISPHAGLQKWTLNGGTWSLAYVLQNGLNLGQPYSIPGYPSPATDGLRNITGRVNADGTVTIWAITSTVSASGDQGADPNKLVAITDVLANTDPTVAATEKFVTLRTAQFGEVLRGVSFTPGTIFPTAPAIPITSSGLIYSRVTRTYNGTITIRNNSSNPISGPIYVLLQNLTQGVTLIGSDTSVIMGLPAVQVLGGGATLQPGQSATAPVAFSDPGGAPINFTPVIPNQGAV